MTDTLDDTQQGQQAEESLVDKASALVPQLRANARTVDEQGRLTDDNIEALTSAGIYLMNKPRGLGGLETPLTEQAAVLAELGRGCPSTAWVASVWMFSSWLAAQFSDRAQEEVYQDPNAKVSGIFTPTATAERVDGGLVVNGKWAFNTGCLHSQWDVLPARVTEDDGIVDLIASLIPTSDLDIEMTWDVDGLAGTGSNTTVARDVFVPEHRTMPMSYVWHDTMLSTANSSSPLFRAPAFPVVMVATAAVPVGIARGALELFLERLPGRAVTYSMHSDQAQTQLAHLQVAEAQTKIDLAWHLVTRMAETIEEHEAAGRQMTLTERARIRSDGAYAARLSREAVEILNSASGASSIRKDVLFRQFFRDMQAVALHGFLNPHPSLEIYGRVLLGLEPGSPML